VGDELTDFPHKNLPPSGNIRVEFTGKRMPKKQRRKALLGQGSPQ